MKIRELLKEAEGLDPASKRGQGAATTQHPDYITNKAALQKSYDYGRELEKNKIPTKPHHDNMGLERNKKKKMDYLYGIYKEDGIEGLIYQEMDQYLVTSIVNEIKQYAKEHHSEMANKFLHIFNDNLVHKITDYVKHMESGHEA